MQASPLSAREDHERLQSLIPTRLSLGRKANHPAKDRQIGKPKEKEQALEGMVMRVREQEGTDSPGRAGVALEVQSLQAQA